MTTTNKKIAVELAKSLLTVGRAKWFANQRNSANCPPDFVKRISRVESELSKLFDDTGYEFGESYGYRIRLNKDR